MSIINYYKGIFNPGRVAGTITLSLAGFGKAFSRIAVNGYGYGMMV